MSIVALLAYASARLSVDVRGRVGDALRLQQSTRATRDFLGDALRNARPPQRPEDTTVSLQGDRLSFVAAGPGPPLDPDYDWRITAQGDCRSPLPDDGRTSCNTGHVDAIFSSLAGER
jgi:hypothetical protein